MNDKLKNLSDKIEFAKQNNRTKKKHKKEDKLRNLMLDFSLTLVFYVILGIYLDKFFHTQPIFLLISVVIGFICSIYLIYKKIK